MNASGLPYTAGMLTRNIALRKYLSEIELTEVVEPEGRQYRLT